MSRRIFFGIVVYRTLASLQLCGARSLHAALQLSSRPTKHSSLLSTWGGAAVRVAEFLGHPSGGDAEAFLFDLSSRGATADVLDLAYRRHPRLHFFLAGLLLAGVAVLVVAVPVGVVACITGGRIPFVGLAARPNNHCLTCCVLLGLLVALLFGDLSTMLASQVTLADAVRRLPDTLAVTLSELRHYVRQTVEELLAELADGDQGVANSIRAFLYGVLPQETLARIASINCLLVTPVNDSLASKLRRCKNATADMFMPGAIVPNTSDVVAESLQLQLNRTLDTVDQLEASFRGFEGRTKLWTRTSVVDVVAVPIVMVLLCVTVALLGFGTGFSIRNCINPTGTTANAKKFTGVIMLANAALVMLFWGLAVPLLMTMTTTAVLAECYVCTPYRENRFELLDRLSQMTWSLTESSPLFAALTPEVVFTKCAGEGTSIAYLRRHFNRTELPYLTAATRIHVTRHWMLQSTTLSTRQNATAGNCRALYGVVRSAMNIFCYKFLEKHAGVALSIAVGLILSVVVLPLTLAVSQCFFAPEDGNIRKTRGRLFKQSDTSREELFGGDADPPSSSSFRGHVRIAKPRKMEGDISYLSMLSKPWRQRLREIYTEEGVDIYDAINRMLTPSERTSWTTTESSEYATPTTTYASSTEGTTSPLSSERTRDNLLLCTSAKTAPRVIILKPKATRNKYVDAVLVEELFPKSSSRKTKIRVPLRGKSSRMSSLHTISEEESSLGSEVSMVTVPSMASEEWRLTRTLSRRDNQQLGSFPSIEKRHVRSNRPAKVTFREDANDYYDATDAMRGLHHTYPPTACVHRYDGGACPCGGPDVVYH